MEVGAWSRGVVPQALLDSRATAPTEQLSWTT